MYRSTGEEGQGMKNDVFGKVMNVMSVRMESVMGVDEVVLGVNGYVVPSNTRVDIVLF